MGYMQKARRAAGRCVVGVGVGVAVLALAACAGGGVANTGGDTAGNEGSAPAAGGSRAPAGGSGGKVTISYIVGASDDPFFSTMKSGAEAAAKGMAPGDTLNWLPTKNYDNFGPDLAKLTQTASSMKSSALISIDPVAEAQEPLLKQVADSGIPVLIVNSGGQSAADKVGALGYIGSDNKLAGKVAGQYMAEHGVKKALCVNTLPGTTFSEERCSGVQEGLSGGGGSSTELPLPSSNFGNPTAVTQAVKAALLKDSSIDGVITTSTTDADSTASALDQAKLTDKVQLATFDISTTQLNRIKDGKQMLAVDQQPYMQGYLATALAYQYVKYGLRLPEKELLTGPALVTKDNVALAIAGTEAGAR